MCVYSKYYVYNKNKIENSVKKKKTWNGKNKLKTKHQ